MNLVKRVMVDSFLTNLAADTPAVSQPIRVLCDDNKEYILKTEYVYDETTKTYQHYNCSFVNEYLAFCIAEHLTVPIPEAAVAFVEKEFLTDEPYLKFKSRFKEGDHFSSFFLEKSEGNLMEDYHSLIQEGKSHLRKPWTKFFGNLTNPEDVAKIIIFDLLIANLDRFNHPGNLLIQNDEGRRIIAIDHGHAFGGPIWSSNKFQYLTQQKDPQVNYINWYCNQHVMYTQRRLNSGIFSLNGMGDIFRALDANYIDISDIKNHSFIQPLINVQSIDATLITSWLNGIPDAWFVDKKTQIDFYRAFLINQISYLPGIIQYLANTNAFESYTGGVLNWSVRNTGTR